jgi:putative ATP-dependent endonuclease of OLD family
MRIYRVVINNFRSIKYLDFRPGKTNLLIGGNNSGKTNVLQALDFALNPYKNWHEGIITEYDFYNRSTEEKGILSDKTEFTGINIEIWFSDFINGEEHQNDWDTCLEHINNKDEIISYDEENNEEAEKFLRVTAECHADLKPLSYFTKPDVEKRRFTRPDKEKVGFHFIPAYRNPLYELSFYQNSFLSKLLERDELKEKIEKLIREIGQSQAVLFEDEKFNKNFESLQKSIQDLKLISSETGAMGLEPLGISERRTLQNFGLVFRPQSSERRVPLKNQGMGAQNAMLILAILQTIKESKHENLVLAFEEPEQNLEPYYQRLLVKKLLKPATRNFQIFMTSYSPEVIKSFSFANIFLVQNQGTKHDLLKISQEENATMEWRKFLNHLERINKEEVISGILARFVLLVEGEAEKGGLPVFSQLSSSGLDDVGVELIWCEGIGGIPKYVEYFKRLNIPVIALCDKDDNICSKKQRNEIAQKSDLTIIWANYEEALLTSPELSSHSKFAEICCSEYDFDENRDVFLNNTFDVEKTPPELKEFYEKEEKQLKTCSDLKKLLSILDKNDLLHYYQKFFFHNSLATVRRSRLIATEICQENEKNIPPAICKLIAVVIEFCEKRLHGNAGDVIKVNSSKIAKVIQTSPFIVEILNG